MEIVINHHRDGEPIWFRNCENLVVDEKGFSFTYPVTVSVGNNPVIEVRYAKYVWSSRSLGRLTLVVSESP